MSAFQNRGTFMTMVNQIDPKKIILSDALVCAS